MAPDSPLRPVRGLALASHCHLAGIGRERARRPCRSSLPFPGVVGTASGFFMSRKACQPSAASVSIDVCARPSMVLVNHGSESVCPPDCRSAFVRE